MWACDLGRRQAGSVGRATTKDEDELGHSRRSSPRFKCYGHDASTADFRSTSADSRARQHRLRSAGCRSVRAACGWCRNPCEQLRAIRNDGADDEPKLIDQLRAAMSVRSSSVTPYFRIALPGCRFQSANMRSGIPPEALGVPGGRAQRVGEDHFGDGVHRGKIGIVFVLRPAWGELLVRLFAPEETESPQSLSEASDRALTSASK